MYLPLSKKRRFGAVVPLAAIIIPVLLGMVAFALDVGWIVLTKTQLQSAADAAALAGADPLMDGYVQYQLASANNKDSVLQTALNNARAKAKEYAAYNWAGDINSLNLLDSDIEFGFTDSTGKYTAGTSTFPNTIKVFMRRDATANGSLKLFFAPVIGTSSADVTATATATIYGGPVDSVSGNYGNVGFLPITYDATDWDTFVRTGLSGKSKVTTAANGLPQLQIYPSTLEETSKGKEAHVTSGNYGQLILNDDNNAGASTMEAWVHNGISPSEIQTLQNKNLIPLSKHDQTKWDWSGKSGFTASLVMAINGYTNKTFILPLYKAYQTDPTYKGGTGNGSNIEYNIVGFVGIKIMPVEKSNSMLVVQPVATVSPAFIFQSNSLAPVGSTTASSNITTFTTPILTQ